MTRKRDTDSIGYYNESFLSFLPLLLLLVVVVVMVVVVVVVFVVVHADDGLGEGVGGGVEDGDVALSLLHVRHAHDDVTAGMT